MSVKGYIIHNIWDVDKGPIVFVLSNVSITSGFDFMAAPTMGLNACQVDFSHNDAADSHVTTSHVGIKQ